MEFSQALRALVRALSGAERLDLPMVRYSVEMAICELVEQWERQLPSQSPSDDDAQTRINRRIQSVMAR